MAPLNTRHISTYEILNHLGSGTYGTIFRARDKQSHEIVALKKMIIPSGPSGFHHTSQREINVLRAMKHRNIVSLLAVAVGDKSDDIYLVLDYCEYDQSTLMERGVRFSPSQIKCIMLQQIAGLCYLHRNFVIHRDLKLSNILLNMKGEVKLADFGLARKTGDPYTSMTPKMVTLWYRSPEIILDMSYTTSADMWSLGCVFGEQVLGKPLLSGRVESGQQVQIAKLQGSVSLNIWSDAAPHQQYQQEIGAGGITYSSLSRMFSCLSSHGQDLLSQMQIYDPDKRITATQAMAHPWFLEAPIAATAVLLDKSFILDKKSG